MAVGGGAASSGWFPGEVGGQGWTAASRLLTRLGHRPLFALEQATGRRQLANTCPVGRPAAELVEVTFMQVTDLEGQKQT